MKNKIEEIGLGEVFKGAIEQIMKKNELGFITDRYTDSSEIETFWRIIVDGLELDFCVDYVQRDCDGWAQSTCYSKKLGYDIVIDNDFPVVVKDVDQVIRIIEGQNKIIKEVEAKIK